MAIRHGRAAKGSLTVSAQDIYESSATKHYPLGQKFELGERLYRYAKNAGVTVAPGMMQMAAVDVDTFDLLSVDDAVVGASKINIHPDTSCAADRFADGWVHVQSGTNLGCTYKIKSHPAIVGSTSTDLELYDQVWRKLSNGDDFVKLSRNQYASTIIMNDNTSATNFAVGVPNISVASNHYYWAQRRGPCGMVLDASAAKNGANTTARAVVIASERTAGTAATVSNWSNAEECRVYGEIITSHCALASDGCLIFLTLE